MFWRQSATDPKTDYLIQPSQCSGGICTGEVIVGGYSHEFKVYRPLVAGVWGPVAEAPIPPRAIATKNFGVTPKQPSPEYSRGGRPITAAEAQAAVLQDDSKQPFLTVISKDFETIVKQLGDLKSTTRLQGYPPGHWAVKDLQPLGEVVYQAPDGKVLITQPHFDAADLTARIAGTNTPSATPIGFGVAAAITLTILFLWRRYAVAQ